MRGKSVTGILPLLSLISNSLPIPDDPERIRLTIIQANLLSAHKGFDRIRPCGQQIIVELCGKPDIGSRTPPTAKLLHTTSPRSEPYGAVKVAARVPSEFIIRISTPSPASWHTQPRTSPIPLLVLPLAGSSKLPVGSGSGAVPFPSPRDQFRSQSQASAQHQHLYEVHH